MCDDGGYVRIWTGRSVGGPCESCGTPFRNGEAFHGPDNDGCVWHHLDNQCRYDREEAARIRRDWIKP